MLSWLRYLTLVLILLVPTAAVDDVIGGIEQVGWRYTARVLLLVVALTFIRLIPPPVKSP
jgi:hypothetical protein